LTQEKKYEVEIAGKKFEIATGKLAKQADGAVTVRCGDTIVLVTAVSSKEARKMADFFPLTVDVEERMYAAGKIPGGFIKREGRPSEKSTLTARLIDRPLRPSFPEGYFNDTQVVSTILSVDQINPFDVLALNGASAALMVSDIPFNGPIGAVRVGKIDGELVINPTYAQLEESTLDIVVAGNKDAILMIEAFAKELPESEVLEALKEARKAIDALIVFQEEIASDAGKAKREVNLYKPKEEIVALVKSFRDQMKEAVQELDKDTRKNNLRTLLEEVKEKTLAGLTSDEENQESEAIQNDYDIAYAFKKLEKEVVRDLIIEGVRPDGRKPTEIRQLTAEAGMLPRTRIHGSGLFTRGQTQVLTVLTLGTVGEEQMLDGLGLEESKRYMHHYNFPPFSVGEAGFMRGPKRRDIGHGALAEKALVPVIPSDEEFPYTIRLVSDVLESNGSTSMASVCGSTLALMDAGVPIKKPIGGIAMGLVKKDNDVVVLTDIQGMEDAIGDMDFKVAGSREGVTAIQMDMKVAGIGFDILEKALDDAKNARFKILDVIESEIPEPRNELSEFAPRVITVKIDTDKIASVIGPGGKVIKGIIEETGAAIDIEQDGTVFISSKDSEGGQKAKQMVEDITREIKVGETFDGEVIRLMSFGAIVQLVPGKDGLVHISKLGKGFVKDIEDVVKIGDKMKVKVDEIDRQGKVRLSPINEEQE
jgi:polyribonucleotide nucleotidyltransferase